MISNPTRKFVNGNDTKSFTYDPGQYPYHLDTIDAGITESWYPFNCLVFADSPEHAKEIYIDMIEHILSCNKKYMASNSRGVIHRDHETSVYRIERILDKLKKVDVSFFERVIPNQPFSVGWAQNDVMF